MKWCLGIGVVILLFQSAFAQMLDLTPATAAVTEVTDPTITVNCALNPLTAVATDTVCGLVIDATSTAEDVYDVPDLTGYTCTVMAGMTVGSVSIPLLDDPVLDDAESLVIDCGTGATGGTLATFTISDDVADTVKMTVVPRSFSYKGIEGAASTVTITVDFYDDNGNIAPIEDDYDIDITFPTSISSDTATGGGVDFTDPAMVTLAGSVMGVATISGTIEIVLVDDTTPENLEHFNAVLVENAIATSIQVGATPTVSVQIADDDKPELIVVSNMTPLPRRSKSDVSMWAITNEGVGPPSGITYTWLPHNLKDASNSESTVGNTDVLAVRTVRPRRNTKSRFNEFTFSKSQTFMATALTRKVHAYLTPTSHTEKQAPIENGISSTLTVYPDAAVCTQLDKTYRISVPYDAKWNRELRWDFIPYGGSAADRITLKKYNGKRELKLTQCDDDGLYIVYRKGRGVLGWEEYIRVILADCPEGMMGTPGTCSAATYTCVNGGVLDQALDLCTCPPGFAGQTCETALAAGTFGSNCDFTLAAFSSANRRGKCVMYGLPDPFGTTCGAGFYGNDCCSSCKTGSFGANCAQTCNCVDDLCDPYSGVCDNGCATGFAGTNCQN